MLKPCLTAAAAITAIAFSSVGSANLVSYESNFEAPTYSVPPVDPPVLGDGWLGFVNVFSPTGAYLYGYGTFDAPNGTGGISEIVAGLGGGNQGDQQLNAYSDYLNTDHNVGNLIEVNLFQEQVIGAADVGSTWIYTFDAVTNNVEGATTADAFIKTLNPNAGFATTNFITFDTSALNDWGTHTLSITIDNALVGQILQFGATNTASNYEGSGVFYDNICFNTSGDCDIGGPPSAVPVPAAVWLFGSGLLGLVGVARRRKS
jgi:hypothetical protein